MCVSAILSAFGAAQVAATAAAQPGSQAATPASQAETKASSGTAGAATTSGGNSADTLLTGLNGVDPKTLQLGKSTLLGE